MTFTPKDRTPYPIGTGSQFLTESNLLQLPHNPAWDARPAPNAVTPRHTIARVAQPTRASDYIGRFTAAHLMLVADDKLTVTLPSAAMWDLGTFEISYSLPNGRENVISLIVCVGQSASPSRVVLTFGIVTVTEPDTFSLRRR